MLTLKYSTLSSYIVFYSNLSQKNKQKVFKVCKRLDSSISFDNFFLNNSTNIRKRRQRQSESDDIFNHFKQEQMFEIVDDTNLEDEIISKLFARQLLQCLHYKKYNDLIKMYFGIDTDPHSLKEISNSLNISKQRVSQIKIRILKYLNVKYRFSQLAEKQLEYQLSKEKERRKLKEALTAFKRFEKEKIKQEAIKQFEDLFNDKICLSLKYLENENEEFTE